MTEYYTQPSKDRYVAATNEQIEVALDSQRDMVALQLDIERLTEELRVMEESCNHTVCYFIMEPPHYKRCCLACGKLLETI